MSSRVSSLSLPDSIAVERKPEPPSQRALFPLEGRRFEATTRFFALSVLGLLLGS